MIKLSKHTIDEMGGRQITRADIEETLDAPELTTADRNDAALTRSYRRIAAYGGRVLRVVWRADGSDTFVVTAHWDRSAKL